ncbi:MAG: type II toxin-antitoxin system HicB family antitoxin [Selenomonas sp.]|jgi:predicted RNase H-like HicB family nuclease|nr:type II toxin-antitoxin system HicB family antitoxin [Selenomonas sp.]MCI7330759.1 type II toxin-antitoxin system HicB family antitoxin [Selenomonadaceae bacterium]MDD6120917.1 type II toxin-antitoxin system HicB family antitoxin [Selenomonadaceae bacterium]MDD7056297.1 type II toxin-antitoxin system HicB family antitoxin [Selenomonadaceae bacterium]MDY3916751.1 type II toxin-antitoxin system HicB family antitoxin [Selenomonadaceae bacterium]
MSRYVFPAVFTPEDGGYVVTFPDWGGATQGEDIADALDMAADFLGLSCWSAEQNHEPIKAPTPLADIPVPKDGFVNLVTADTEAYQKIIDRENNPIKYAREQAGLNIKALADLLGAPYRTVQDWNAGRRMPPKWMQALIVEKIEAAS